MNSSSTTTRRPSALQARSTLAAIVALTAIGGSVLAAPFTLGNLVVSRVGDGTSTLSGAGAAVFLDEYTTALGQTSAVQSVALPTTASGSNASFVDSGTSTSDGTLTLSTNGKFLTIAGYAGAVGTASITSVAGINRVVARIAANGTVDTTTSLNQTTTYSGNNIRSAASTDGTTLFLGGTASSTGGVRTANLGDASSTQVEGTTTNTRVVNLFNGNLYFSTGSGTAGIYQIGSGGISTASGQTTTLIAADPAGPIVAPATTNNGSPYDFYFANANTLFVADDRSNANGGLLQYVNSGSGFTLTNTYNLAGATTGTTAGLRGLTGSATDLFAISSDNRLVDFNLSSTSFTTLATAATNTNFRGVDFAPNSGTLPAAAPEPSQVAGLGFFAFGLAGVILKARRKRSTASVNVR